MTTLLSLLLFAIYEPADVSPHLSESYDALEGQWQVDLRRSPDAAPYFKTLELKVKKGGQLAGRFYGSKFKKGIVNDAWPRLYFAFRTRDKNNTYFHTGYLDGEALRGQTYCPERSFIAPWTATRFTETMDK